jgi:hypothetical protein
MDNPAPVTAVDTSERRPALLGSTANERRKHMEIVLLMIGLPGALGCLALGLGVFVLDKPPPTSVVRPRSRTVGASRSALRLHHCCPLQRKDISMIGHDSTQNQPVLTQASLDIPTGQKEDAHETRYEERSHENTSYL